jgi:hypothetical protein
MQLPSPGKCMKCVVVRGHQERKKRIREGKEREA